MRSPSLDKTNRIHPTAWIEDGAVLGRNNTIGPNCYIGSAVRIGDNNYFSGFASIGMPAEHRDYFHKEGEVVIGHRNMVREFVTINSSTHDITVIGDDCVMLRGSHLSHDSILENRVNVSCNVLIGGESYIMEGANLGLGCIIHQRQVVGSYAMIGMGAVITKGLLVEPGYIFVGNPARKLKPNTIGLERANISDLILNDEVRSFESILKTRSRQ